MGGKASHKNDDDNNRKDSVNPDRNEDGTFTKGTLQACFVAPISYLDDI